MLTYSRRRKPCAIHHRFDCCGQKESVRGLQFTKAEDKWKKIRAGLWRIEDSHHARGFREKRSPAALRELVDRKIEEQVCRCFYCLEKFTDRRQVVAAHIEPRSMGGAWRDDHPSNIAAAHSWCNTQNGSKRPAEVVN